MNEIDRKVLERIGYNGAELAEILEAAGGDYDIDALIRTGYVRIHRERLLETSGTRFGSDEYLSWYVLTPKAAEEIGLDPTVLASR
jgi:hypothetical protein